jgi:mono/diheme cytochrome c family protein
MNNCHFCHGDGVVSSSVIPDLRYLSDGKHKIFNQILLDGLFKSIGMPSFQGRLTAVEAEAIRQYIVQKTIADFGKPKNPPE